MVNGQWAPAVEKYGIVVSSYQGCGPHDLKVKIGEPVQILEQYTQDGVSPVWYRGCLLSNRVEKGIFPASFVHTKSCSVENEGPFETVIPTEDSVIKELTYVLREWFFRWKELFVQIRKPQIQRNNPFQSIRLVMEELIKNRSILVADTFTKEQALILKQNVVTLIDWGNSQLEMDLVPRLDYQQADPDKVSIVEMYRIHQQSVENCRSARPGSRVSVRSTDSQGELIHHLQVTVCSFECTVGEQAEVYLSLYDNTESRFVTERFVTRYDKDGGNLGNEKSFPPATLFTDLSGEDTKKDLYVVVQIYRYGRLLAEGNSKKVLNFKYRRPWGVAVVSVREVFQRGEGSETCHKLRVQCVESEVAFPSLHEALIKRPTQSSGKGVPHMVAITLCSVLGDLQSVQLQNPTLYKSSTRSQRLGFSEFIYPGEVRNDLYLTLSCAELDRGNKTASKNVEVCVTVFDKDYECIKDCIIAANGDEMSSNYLSYVFYHNNSPAWQETVRLSIPVEKFNTAHIRLELYHCSNRDKVEKKLFGFAFISVITPNSTTRLDGEYKLILYKCEDIHRIKRYLSQPSLLEDLNDPKETNLLFPRSAKEYVTIKTLLCSTKFAQKTELLSVLQWSSKRPEDIPACLNSLMTLKGELVRYLQDVLDALFAMLSSNSSSNETDPNVFHYSTEVFQTLVYIFNLLQQSAFQKFSIVLENYLEKTFSYPVAHRDLMKCLESKVEKIYTCSDFDSNVKENSSKKMFAVLSDIFKFAVKSCMLSQSMFGSQGVLEFRSNMTDVFKALGTLLQSPGKELHKPQAQLLSNLHLCYVPLLHIMTNSELAEYVCYILSKINKEPGISVSKAKTTLIKNTINSPLMSDPDSRSKLLIYFLDHLKKSLRSKSCLELSASTLGDLLSFVYKNKEVYNVKDEVSQIIRSVFDTTVRALRTTTDNQKDISCILLSSLMEMLRLMDDTHYQKLMSDYPKPRPLKDFLHRLLLVFRDFVKMDVFPADWTTMKMISNTVMLTSIQYVAQDLTLNFLQGSDFDRELWYNFFMLTTSFITQPALQLEKYSKAKRSKIKDRYYDMRVPVGCHIHALWNDLGSHKEELLMELIGPFLEISMVPELELRKATIPIFWDIMKFEFALNKDLRRVEAKMVYELDNLVLEHRGEKSYKDLFNSMLLDKVQTGPEEIQDEGKRFVCSVTSLIEKLLDYREIMDREEQRDTKMHCTFDILNIYSSSRQDMYIRYINRLFELHYHAENFVEAGLTLRIYAELLPWGEEELSSEMNYSTQSEADRKELLYSKVLECFEKGQAWEYGISVCKELAKHYEETFQYKKLSDILRRHASLLSYILQGQDPSQAPRLEPMYYRVAFYGSTFPPYLKNKAFIYRMTYRDNKAPNLEAIMNQLKLEYPAASILHSNTPPDDNQYIQITCVKPQPSTRAEFEGKNVPEEISSFYQTNEIDTFLFDRPYHRDNKDKNNEFKSLCLERTKIKTSYKLPGILPWYAEQKKEVIHLCPVQTATNTVQQMNEELRSSTANASHDPKNKLSHLLMRLQGVISGAVNGGIPMYQEAFFNEEYTNKYPEEKVYIEELKTAILEQLEILDKGLLVHGRHVGDDMRPLHDELQQKFLNMRTKMGYHTKSLSNRNSGISFNSSQRPSTPSSNSANSSGSNRSSVTSVNEHDSLPPDLEESRFASPALPCPLYPDKRRASSLRTTTLTNDSISAAKHNQGRPLSAIVTTNNHLQCPLPPATRASSDVSLPEQYFGSAPVPPRKLNPAIVSAISVMQPPPIPIRGTASRKSTQWSDLDRNPGGSGSFTLSPPVTEEDSTDRPLAPPRPPRSTMPVSTNSVSAIYSTPHTSQPNLSLLSSSTRSLDTHSIASPTGPAIPPLPDKRLSPIASSAKNLGGSLGNLGSVGNVYTSPLNLIKNRATVIGSNNNISSKPSPATKPKPPLPKTVKPTDRSSLNAPVTLPREKSPTSPVMPLNESSQSSVMPPASPESKPNVPVRRLPPPPPPSTNGDSQTPQVTSSKMPPPVPQRKPSSSSTSSAASDTRL